MLTHLRIQNLAIISSCELEFDSGFTVLTGETGAGKSIIIDAISLLLGESASEDLIQSGQNFAYIEGQFKLATLPETLTPFVEPGEPVIIWRKLSRKIAGEANSCRINNQTVPLKTLRSAMTDIINIIGQHEHMHLLSTDKQLQWLDDSSPKILAQKTIYHTQYQVWKTLQKELDQSQTHQTDLAQRKAFLAFQCQDIESHHFKADEEDTLNAARKTLQNHHKIQQLQNTATTHLDALQNEETQLLKALQNLSVYDPKLQAKIDALLPFSEELADLQSHLTNEIQQTQQLENLNIDDVESRLDTLFKLKTKYAMPTLASLLDHLNTLKTQLNTLENNDTHQLELQAQTKAALSTLQALGTQLTQDRQAIAATIKEKIIQALTELHFNHPQFDIVFTPTPTPIESGCDHIAFHLSPNPGEPLKPLAKIASGGELSRIMLAIKSIFATNATVPTLIFDEVDTGVGGLTANKIGEFLHRIATTSQTFCITHLPQIARLADHHFVVSKSVVDQRTHTTVFELKTEAEKSAELHRMVGGSVVVDAIK